jgi:hypothetical protein
MLETPTGAAAGRLSLVSAVFGSENEEEELRRAFVVEVAGVVPFGP